MLKKHHITALELAAGGAVLAAVSVVVAPAMIRTGLKTIRKYASQFVLDPETGQIRRKDEGVIQLQEGDYRIEER